MEPETPPPEVAQGSSENKYPVTVKTLDSQNHVFNISDNMEVRDFKAEISEKIGIPADQQRLIFRGRVLQDDKKMCDYKVANNTIHVVQRPANGNNARNNDEPTMNVPRGSDRNPNAAVLMGTIGLPNIDIQAHAGQSPLGAFGRRAGASVRLQLSSRMLTQASAMLQRLEQDDTISLDQTSTQDTGTFETPLAGTETTSTSSVPAASGNSEQQGIESVNNNNRMDVDGEENNTFGRMISQVANAASAAAIMAAIRQGSSEVGGNAGLQNQSPTHTQNQNRGVGQETNTASGESTQRRPDVPAPPRLREMAVIIQDILAFQERLAPYLQFVQNILQENRQYDEAAAHQSSQFVFDTTSAILHYLSHSYHALSDIICDFSTPAETRRLRAATAILVEQSTVVRATIPIGANVMAANAHRNNQTSAANIPPPTANSTTSATTGNTTTNASRVASANPIPNPLSSSTNLASNQIPSGANPALNLGPQMQQLFANMANSGQFGSMGPSGSVGGEIQEIHVNIGPGGMPQIHTPASAAGTMPVMIGGGPGVSVMMGVGPDPSQHMNLGAMGQGGGMNFNLQDLTAMLGPAMSGILPMLNNPAAQQQMSNNNSIPTSTTATNPNQQQNTATPQAQTATAGGAANLTASNNNNNNSSGINAAVAAALGGNGNFQVQLSPFDLLLACSSHHGSRNQQNTRPANFRQYVNVAQGQTQATNQDSDHFMMRLMDVVFYSNLLPLSQPMLQDVILNYLMRGRDARNKEHVKSCAKSMAKKLVAFLESFSAQIAGRNTTVLYPETFVNLLTIFLTELMMTTMNNSNSDYKSAVLTLCEVFVRNLLSIFKICFSGCDNYIKKFATYLSERLLGGTSLVFREHVAARLSEYLSSLNDPLREPPSDVVVYRDTSSAPGSSTSGSSVVPESLPPAPIKVPSASVSPRSAVLPPKQPRPSPRSEMNSSMDEDIDNLINMRTTTSAPMRAVTGVGLPNPQNLEAMLRNIPSEWTETVRNDFMRQLGMPDQPPFSPGYVALLSRKPH